MAIAAIVAIAILCTKHITAAPAPAFPSSSNPRCIDLTLPVSITSHNNAIYNVNRVDSNIDAIAYALLADSRHTGPAVDPVLKNTTISGTWNIAAKLCVPKQGAKKNLLQIATHGGIFDQRYWDARIDPKQYSYVDNALDAGYSILTYDRLGNGGSDKPDAYKVLQLPLEVEVLRAVTEIARAGGLMQHAKSGSKTPAEFDKIIHVGHSIGSATTIGYLTTYGNQSDGAVITGWIQTYQSVGYKTTSFDLAFAAENDPKRFGDYPSGYVVPSTTTAIQEGFFSIRRNTTVGIGGFTPEILDYGEYIKSPVGVTELMSAGRLNFNPATEFKAPVHIVLGEFDFLVCDGDCKGLIDMDLLKKLWPAATGLETYIQPGTGHGLPLHRGANIGYKKSFDFLDRNGL